MTVTSAAGIDQAFRALADANRRAILSTIKTGPQPVGTIAREVGLSQQTTSHHLGVLRAANLATVTQEGTRHLFVANTDGLAVVRSFLDDFWPTKLAALKDAVENQKKGSDYGEL